MNVVFLYKYLQIARTKLVNNKDSNSNNNTDSNNESYTKKKINRKGNIHRITTATTSWHSRHLWNHVTSVVSTVTSILNIPLPSFSNIYRPSSYYTIDRLSIIQSMKNKDTNENINIKSNVNTKTNVDTN